MRLLLADDETELTAALYPVLVSQGYNVDTVADGEQAWQQCTQHPYNVLVLDWRMPGRNGVELCRALRQRGDRTPILLLTAKDTLDDRVTGLDSGADDYLVKPFELRELLARIRALLRRGAAPDFTLDPASRTVWKDGTAIALSEKEFALLQYFATHPQQLVTRETLQAHLWPEGAPASNALVAQIRLLRRKIDPPHGSHITAIYGRGYRFDPVLQH